MLDKFNTKPNLHNYEHVKGHNISTLPTSFEGVEMGSYNPRNKIWDKDGSLWHELNNEGDEDLPHYQVDQMFLVKLLKGIMPVCDIVCVQDAAGERRFFSKEVPDFEFPRPEFAYDPIFIRPKISMTVEDFFLFYIFRDGDHFITYPKQHNSVYKWFPYRLNIHSIFDFEGAVSFWSSNPQFADFEEDKTFQSLTPDTKKAIAYYIEKLKGMYSGDGGLRHISAILKNIEE